MKINKNKFVLVTIIIFLIIYYSSKFSTHSMAYARLGAEPPLAETFQIRPTYLPPWKLELYKIKAGNGSLIHQVYIYQHYQMQSNSQQAEKYLDAIREKYPSLPQEMNLNALANPVHNPIILLAKGVIYGILMQD